MNNDIHKFRKNTGVERKRKILSRSLGKWVEVKWESEPELFFTIIGKFTRLDTCPQNIMAVLGAHDEFRERWILIEWIREVRIFAGTPKRFRPKALLRAKREKELESAQETCRLNQEQERLRQVLERNRNL